MSGVQEQPEVGELEDLEIREQLERIEQKPPMYRIFRVALYSLYLLIAGWLVISIAIGAWHSVYGEAGKALKAQSSKHAPLGASPNASP